MKVRLMQKLFNVHVVVFLCGLVGTAHGFQLRKSEDGKVLIWEVETIQLVIDTSSIPGEPGADDAVFSGFTSWTSAGLGIRLSRTLSSNTKRDGSDRVNVIRWETENWEFEPEIVAITISSYDRSTGFVRDSDVVFNAVDHTWTTQPDANPHSFDVENVMAHEAGHFFGMGHSESATDATMFPSTPTGETDKRSLADDDLQGLAALVDEMSQRAPATRTPSSGNQAGTGGTDDSDLTPRAGCSVGPSAGLSDWGVILVCLLLALTRRMRRLAHLVAILPALLWSPAAQATTVKGLTLKQLANTAQIVVEGRVLRSEGRLIGGMIVTEHRVAVKSCHKGTCKAEVVVRTLGGEVGDRGMYFEGAAKLRAGQDVVLFARARGSALRPVGMAQGAFRLEQGFAVRQLRGLSLVKLSLDGVDSATRQLHTTRGHLDANRVLPERVRYTEILATLKSVRNAQPAMLNGGQTRAPLGNGAPE